MGDNYNSNTNLCDTICLCLQINVLDISVEPTELQELLEETAMVWPEEGQPCSVKGCPATDHVFTRIGFYRAYFLKFHKAKDPVYSVPMPWSQVHYSFLQIASFEGACKGKHSGISYFVHQIIVDNPRFVNPVDTLAAAQRALTVQALQPLFHHQDINPRDERYKH